MARSLSTWHYLSESYTENTVLASYSHDDATGQSWGVVGLVKKKEVKVFCAVSAGTSLPANPAENAQTHKLSLNCLGTTQKIEFAALTSTNSFTNATATNGWQVLGPAVATGYESEALGLIRWELTMTTEGLDVKRGSWYGSMTPAKFRGMTHVSPE